MTLLPIKQVDLWPDIESGIRITCDVGYLCANFSLPTPLCSRVRPDVRDRQTDRQKSNVRQTDVRQKHRLMPPPYGGGSIINWTSCARGDTIFPRPCKLTFDLLTLKVVSESRVTWATCVPILFFLGLSVLDSFPMYATDRQTDISQHHRLMPPPTGAGHNKQNEKSAQRDANIARWL